MELMPFSRNWCWIEPYQALMKSLVGEGGERHPIRGRRPRPSSAPCTCLAPLERSSSGDFGYETGGALGAGGG